MDVQDSICCYIQCVYRFNGSSVDQGKVVKRTQLFSWCKKLRFIKNTLYSQFHRKISETSQLFACKSFARCNWSERLVPSYSRLFSTWISPKKNWKYNILWLVPFNPAILSDLYPRSITVIDFQEKFVENIVNNNTLPKCEMSNIICLWRRACCVILNNISRYL